MWMHQVHRPPTCRILAMRAAQDRCFRWMRTLNTCPKQRSSGDTENLPDVHERVELYNLQRQDYIEQIARCSGLYGNVAAIDLRENP